MCRCFNLPALNHVLQLSNQAERQKGRKAEGQKGRMEVKTRIIASPHTLILGGVETKGTKNSSPASQQSPSACWHDLSLHP